jgi:hypothetical protein
LGDEGRVRQLGAGRAHAPAAVVIAGHCIGDEVIATLAGA